MTRTTNYITFEFLSRSANEGFARGAVLAAEFLKGKNGVLGMEDMLKF